MISTKTIFIRSVVFYVIILVLMLGGCMPQPLPEPETQGPNVRVLLAELDDTKVISFTGSYYLTSEEADYEFAEKNNRLIAEPIPDGIRIFNDFRNLLYRNHFPIVLKPREPEDHFIIDEKEYAGEIHFVSGEQGKILIVNHLPLEEYLKGVVPAEIFATRTDYYQAVKAQAICARTYALKQLEASKNRAYDLRASVADQVYDGFKRHTQLADQAVLESRGTVITYQGATAQVYYHSTCGGRLEAAGEVFAGSDLAYLQTTTDAVGDVLACSASPTFRWIESRTFAELDSAFNANFGKSPYTQAVNDTMELHLNFRVTTRSSGGRAAGITISYADTSVELSGYDIRRFFARAPDQYLPSNLFYLAQNSDSTLSITGAGNGHGVGMCQYGALNMSQRGFQYYHIIGKYFPGTELARIY